MVRNNGFGKNWCRFYAVIAVLFFVNTLFFGSAYGLVSPKEQVEQTAEQTIKILNSSGMSWEVKQEYLRKVIFPFLDFEEIAKRTLALHYKVNENRIGEFSLLLNEFLARVYINAALFDSAKGARIVVLGETVDGKFAVVKSKIVTVAGRETEIDYRLIFKDGNWKVYDIVVEGISMVGSYRVQFDRIIRNSSFDGLLQELRKKISELKNRR